MIIILSMATFVNAAVDKSSSKAEQAFINDMVANYGFNKKELISILNKAKYQPKIIESMNNPYEKKSWDAYKKLFLTQNRVDAGLEFLNANKEELIKVEKKYGVPANIIVAIIGVETLYGKRQGEYRVLDALTTLAFHYPKRSAFFTKELREYLLLCREQKISPTKYLGSYAGAIGAPQFMPSSYRFYAVDASGNGQADLMNQNKDIIHSVANYFVKNGWKSDAEVAEPAKVSGKKYKKLSVNTKTAGYSFTDILSSGVKPSISRMKHPKKAGLIRLETVNGHEYWIAYENFYVITRYNTSPQYALVVYLLAEKLHEKGSIA